MPSRSRWRLDLDLPQRREPARVDVSELGSTSEERVERSRIAQWVVPGATRLLADRRQPRKGRRVRRGLRDRLDERALGGARVSESHLQVGELEQELRLLHRVAFDLGQAPEEVAHLRRIGGGTPGGFCGDESQETAEGSWIGRIRLEGQAEHPLGVDRARENLVVDARQREEGREARRRIAACARDRAEGLDGFGPGALRDAKLREREKRRHVLRGGLAHAAHRFDGDRKITKLVARDLRDLCPEEDDHLGRTSPADRRPERLYEVEAVSSLELQRHESLRDGHGIGVRVERPLEKRCGAVGSLGRRADRGVSTRREEQVRGVEQVR
jgi:hypothetical protein